MEKCQRDIDRYYQLESTMRMDQRKKAYDDQLEIIAGERIKRERIGLGTLRMF